VKDDAVLVHIRIRDRKVAALECDAVVLPAVEEEGAGAVRGLDRDGRERLDARAVLADRDDPLG
jgi:hypothetical protein